jgi:gliding motility-associated-like protein
VNLLVKPITNVSVNASICQGASYTLPNGNVVTTQGSYPVSFLGSNGCDSIVTTNLTVNPTTINNVPATICINDTYTFVDGTTSNISGTYSHILVGANSKGCDSLIVTQLSVVPLPVALLDDYVLCAGQNDSVTLSVDENTAFSYLWSNGSTNSFIKVFQTDTFSVVVSAPPCPSVTDSSIVEVLDCTCKVFIPSAFSPNDDGINDGFKPTIKCLSAVLNYKFLIFNRWGQRIFDTYDINTVWDGKYQGVTQDIGTYYYQIQFSHPDVGNKLYKGDINLIR